jgi:benzoyl-CoA reductase/2-hydroxyglutaryl-CoA dehydratase subunit BcrC/BadD/HgdB
MEIKSEAVKPKESATQKTTAVKSTEAAKEVYNVVKSLYTQAQQAMAAKAPIAWLMVGCLAEEILKAMEVVPVYPENYAAVCAAKKAAQPFIGKAEAAGYSSADCGYARTGIGYAIARQEMGMIPPFAPLGGMADPQMLIGSSYACDTRYKWFQTLARYMDVPYCAVDVVHPPADITVTEVEDYYLDYQVDELKRLVAFVEKHTGKKMDYDKLSELVNIAEQTRKAWSHCYEMRKAVPGPMPTQDMLSCVVPGKFNPSAPEALAFYRRLENELQYRIDHKIGVVDEEKYRLMFIGLPPWHGMKIFNYLESLGAVCVIENIYYPGKPSERAARFSDPLRRMAADEMYRWAEMWGKMGQDGTQPEIDWMRRWVDEYKVDGILIHTARSCRLSATMQVTFRNILQDFVKIPILSIESDIIDERSYSEAQVKAQIDAFMEILASSKKEPASKGRTKPS